MRNALFYLRAFSDECHAMVVQNECPCELAVWRGARCVALVPLTPAEYARLRRVLVVPQRLHPLSYCRNALRAAG